MLQTLNRYFFGDLGFGGNLNHYHDPENSYLHAVLQTRRGIPVSLAVLWLELAGGIGLSVHGVGFPGHFLVRADLPDGSILLDPFTGESLNRDDLWERLDSIRPGGDARQATGALLDGYLRPVAPRSVIARMLFNLKEIHRSLEDWPRNAADLEHLLAGGAQGCRAAVGVRGIDHDHHADAVVEGAVHLDVVDARRLLQPGKQLGLRGQLPFCRWAAVPSGSTRGMFSSRPPPVMWASALIGCRPSAASTF
jgi:hypothetical protein